MVACRGPAKRRCHACLVSVVWKYRRTQDVHSSLHYTFVLSPLPHMQAPRCRNYRAPTTDNRHPAAGIPPTHGECYSDTSLSATLKDPNGGGIQASCTLSPAWISFDRHCTSMRRPLEQLRFNGNVVHDSLLIGFCRLLRRVLTP